MPVRPGPHRESGFSLIEVLVALGLIVILITSVSPLFALATTSNASARARASATLLAEEKLEELGELAFGFDPQGAPMTDVTTDTAGEIATGGGTGLAPGGAVDRTVARYSDYLDVFGRRTAATGAAFVRRWSIGPVPGDPANSIVIQVVVLRPADGTSVRLVTMRTRKAR